MSNGVISFLNLMLLKMDQKISIFLLWLYILLWVSCLCFLFWAKVKLWMLSWSCLTFSCLKTWGRSDGSWAITEGICGPCSVLWSFTQWHCISGPHVPPLSYKDSFTFKIICCVFDLFKNPYHSNKSSHARIKFVCGTDALSLLMNLPISVLCEAYLQGLNDDLKGNNTVKRFPLKIFLCSSAEVLSNSHQVAKVSTFLYCHMRLNQIFSSPYWLQKNITCMTVSLSHWVFHTSFFYI